MKIVQFSSSDSGGGAERSALNLHRQLLARNIDSHLVVGQKSGSERNVHVLNSDRYRNPVYRKLSHTLSVYDSGPLKLKGAGRVLRGARSVSEPLRWFKNMAGVEDMDYPGIRSHLAEFCDVHVIHCHNLHGGYFDLRVLPEISKRHNLVLNIRDSWLFTGHCALPVSCHKWRTGCGACPDLERYPSIRRDATAANWRRKQRILSQSRFYLCAPSQWMLNQVKDSMLVSGAIESRVIGNAFDATVFHPGDRLQARSRFCIEPDEFVVVTAGLNLLQSGWKNFPTMRDAVVETSNNNPHRKIRFLAIGAKGEKEKINRGHIEYVPYTNDPRLLADYYRLADVYLHASKVESFGNVLMEAKACGAAIVAPAVGGIPEHVKSMHWSGVSGDISTHESDEAHGLLVAAANSQCLTSALNRLANDPGLVSKLGNNGARDAAENYTLPRQAERFIDWYNLMPPKP